jgi:hypothetical protein
LALKVFDAIRLFGQFVEEGLVSSGEVARFWKLIEAECHENSEVTFNLCKMLKETRSWDDETLCRELRIRAKTWKTSRIGRNRHLRRQWALECSTSFSPRWRCDFSV